MPSNVGTLLSGGVSVGILAGVVSGLFYLVVAGFRWAGEVRNQSGEWFQKQLQRRLRAPAVGDLDHRSDGSIMASESAHVREFIERLVESLVAGGLDHVNVNRLYSHPDYDRMFETYHGALCDVLARLSFALQMAIANKPLDDSDSPSAAHAELKQLVSKVVCEAMTLPAFQQGLADSSTNCNNKAPQDDINSKTYEDILATAILNKVIERYQQCSLVSPASTDGNSNLLYKTTNMEQQQKFISRVEIGCGTSYNSLDETGAVSPGGSSWSESSQVEPQSLTLEECIEEEEEVTMYSSEEEEEGDTSTGAELDFYLSGLNFIKRHRVPFPELGMDIVDGRDEEQDSEGGSPQPTDLLSPEDSWEDNWLFQRRRLKVGGVHNPMPVPMLVPNPSEDYRALIGDRDAEETSDLSECSDGIYDDIQEMELIEQIMRNEDDTTGTEEAVNLAEARNTELANSIDSSSEYGQQDSEYTEDYASATRRQMNSLTRGHDLDMTSKTSWGHDFDTTSKPTPTPRTRTMVLDDSSVEDHAVNVTRATFIADSSETDLATPPRPGTIAEREHRKWESAVPLENNPYSSENILKRLNRSAVFDIRPNCQLTSDPIQQSNYQPKPEKISEPAQPDVTRYGRDYYVNASKTSTGCIDRNYLRPVEIVMSPTIIDQPREVFYVKNSEVKAAQLLETTSPHVGSEVTRLQKEINQKEQLWLKTINRNDSDQKTDSKLSEVTNGSDITRRDKLYDIDAPVVVLRRQQKPKLENSTCKNLKNGLLNAEATENNPKRQEVSVTTHPNGNVVLSKKVSDGSKSVCATNGDAKRIVNGSTQKKSTLMTSRGSSASSDSEPIIAMPSVRDLAKQFTARSTDSSSPSKSPSPVNRSHTSPTTKKQQPIIIQSRQPMREVHSLTARSISRVFREELKRSQAPHAPPDCSDCSQSQVSSSDACYTSDESSTSPTPGSLRNNIQFWETINK